MLSECDAANISLSDPCVKRSAENRAAERSYERHSDVRAAPGHVVSERDESLVLPDA